MERSTAYHLAVENSKESFHQGEMESARDTGALLLDQHTKKLIHDHSPWALAERRWSRWDLDKESTVFMVLGESERTAARITILNHSLTLQPLSFFSWVDHSSFCDTSLDSLLLHQVEHMPCWAVSCLGQCAEVWKDSGEVTDWIV